MNPRSALLTTILLAFAAFTTIVVLDVGYGGIFDAATASKGATQVFIDLVIVCVLASLWLIDDARRRGVRAWPWVIGILFAGSLGLMAYLLVREVRGTAPARVGRADGQPTATAAP